MGGSGSLFGRLQTRLSGNRAIGLMACVTLAGGLVVAPLGNEAASATGPCDAPVTSVIACENSLPGSTAWEIQGAGDPTIQGFATSISVTANATVHFKIETDASSYHVDIFRLGYYGGAGARLVASDIAPSASLPQSQPPCLNDASTGLVDCGDWAESASWAVPSSAVSGVYLALLTRADTGGKSQIPFVVKDPASHSSIVFQTSDATWQAYNSYGGNSFYTGDGSLPDGRAYKVSYNRPFDTADTHPTSWLLNNEFPMISFLERNGFDVSYETAGDVDADTGGTLLQNHQVFMSVGHDEYWSGNQRTNVQAARDAGVNLAFFSGNLMFWKARWENSVDGTNAARRTLVSYKETHANALIDPQDPPTWTGTWRDPRFTPQSDGGQPENSLTGQLGLDSDGQSYAMTVPSKYKSLRFWRNTSIPLLAPGEIASLAPNTLGDEFDVDVDNGFRPAGLIDMSSTTIDSPGVFQDYGTVLQPGTATNSITLYKAPSGALVFDTGTIQWAFGLDPGAVGSETSTDMQQATVNILADMNAQPASLMDGLVAASKSTDTTAPTSTITSPSAGANLANGSNVTITGTATDVGGVVAGVEVSTDGGTTWHPASGTSNWSYTWNVNRGGATSILSRATDDSGNTQSPGTSVAVTGQCPCSLLGATVPAVPDSGDAGANVELGVKFTTDTAGFVSGVRFYKSTLNTGVHSGSLWSTDGTLLANATFTGETASGWQQVSFSPPVAVTAGTTYVASYHTTAGHYAATNNAFWGVPVANGLRSYDSPPLHAPTTQASGGNGVFQYGPSAYPSSTAGATNYWVDPVFTTSGGTASVPGAPSGVSASAGEHLGDGELGSTVERREPDHVVHGDAVHRCGRADSDHGDRGAARDLDGGDLAHERRRVHVRGDRDERRRYRCRLRAVELGDTERGRAVVSVHVVRPDGPRDRRQWRSRCERRVGREVHGGHFGVRHRRSVLQVGGEHGRPHRVAVVVDRDAVGVRDVRRRVGLGLAAGDVLAAGRGDRGHDVRRVVPHDGRSLLRRPGNGFACRVRQLAAARARERGRRWQRCLRCTGRARSRTRRSTPRTTGSTWCSTRRAGRPTVPGAPTGVSASAGDASATVSWVAPVDGGSPITSYTVTPFVGAVAQSPTTVTGAPPATSTVVTGLTNGTAYTFTVTATNGGRRGRLVGGVESGDADRGRPGVPVHVVRFDGARGARQR